MRSKRETGDLEGVWSTAAGGMAASFSRGREWSSLGVREIINEEVKNLPMNASVQFFLKL